MARLSGKLCLVTGAAQGIGRAIAEAFLAEGARVIASDLNAEGPAGWRHEALEYLPLDVTDAEAVTVAAQRFPTVDVLVNCVGLVLGGTVLDDDPVAALERSMSVNVYTMARTIHAFLPGMLRCGRGSIINISSVVSSVKAAPNRFVYATSKAAVIGLTKAVARDFIDSGVRCNSISPGTVDSPSFRQRVASDRDPTAAMAAFIARQPMGRLGLPVEIAAVALLLASDEARFMSGENIVIDGGMSL